MDWLAEFKIAHAGSGCPSLLPLTGEFQDLTDFALGRPRLDGAPRTVSLGGAPNQSACDASELDCWLRLRESLLGSAQGASA